MKGMESINSWSKRAKCRVKTEVDFFPDAHSPHRSAGKKFCRDCPVMSLCKTYAIAHNEIGIWGGTDYKERQRLESYLVNAIRQMYQEAGLLEYRSAHVVSEFLELREILLPVYIPQQQIPNAHLAS